MIEAIYQVGYTYLPNEIYEMTIKELLELVENRKQYIAYKIWRQAYMNSFAIWDGKNYPKTPQEAMPELYPPKQEHIVKMPPNMQKKYIEQLKKGFANGK